MNTPLVSINVLSYNAAPFIEETLDSIKAQTYHNIELVVSDDASTDETVQICKDWLSKNKDRFVNTLLLTVDRNTGVSGNANRALAASKGAWRKGIGSDDLLLPDCVENFIRYINSNPDAKFVFGKDIKFRGDFSECNFEKCELPFRALCLRDSVSARYQHKFLTRQFFGCPPGAFMNIDAVKNVGAFDESHPMNEDHSLYLRLTKAGIKLWYLDEYVVYRRINMRSISRSKDVYAILSKNQIRSCLNQGSQYEFQSAFWQLMTRFEKSLTKKVIDSGNDSRIFKCRFYNFLRRWLNPFKWDQIIAILKDKMLNLLGY